MMLADDFRHFHAGVIYGYYATCCMLPPHALVYTRQALMMFSPAMLRCRRYDDACMPMFTLFRFRPLAAFAIIFMMPLLDCCRRHAFSIDFRRFS